MSIQSEITRITNAIASAYSEADAKGATMPTIENVANLAQTIASISGGGGNVITGTTVLTSTSTRLVIPHNLGAKPRFCIASAPTGNSNTSCAGFCANYENPTATGDRRAICIRQTSNSSKTVTDNPSFRTSSNYHYVDNEVIDLASYSTSYPYAANTYVWAVVL